MKPIRGKMLLCALALALLALAPGLRQAKATVLFGGGDVYQQVASVGGTLYIARPEGLYAYRPGDDTPRRLMDFLATDLLGNPLLKDGSDHPRIAALMAGDGGLYALDFNPGGLWRFDEGRAVFTREAAFDTGEAFADGAIYSGFLWEGGDVYCVARSETGAGTGLMKLDISEGTGALVRSDIRLAVPYAPGVLLVGTDAWGNLGSLALLNTKTGRMEEKCKLEADYGELMYDAQTDTAYLVGKGEIFASKAFAPPVPVSRIPVKSPISNSALLSGSIALPYGDGVRIFSTDPALMAAQPLKIFGQTSDLPVEAFAAQNPDIAFSFTEAYPETAMDLVRHMMSGETAADVYALYLRELSIDDLYEKGYFADLSGSEAVYSAAEQMYPYLKDTLVRDGQIVALPFRCFFSVNGYNPAAFSEVGLTESDVPQTYGELMDFVSRWQAEYAEKYPSMSLFGQDADTHVVRLLLITSILEDRLYDCMRRFEKVSYSTPEMLALLEQFAAADFTKIRAIAPGAPGGEDTPFGEPPSQLFLIGGFASTQDSISNHFAYMPLKLSHTAKPVVMADMQVMLINPYTQNFDKALAFVSFAAKNMPAILRADLMPGENEPVRDAGLDLSLLEENIRLAEKALLEAGEEDRRTMEDKLDNFKAQYAFEKRFEFLSTPDSISAFRTLGDFFVLQKPNPVYGMGANEELSDLIYRRFLDGQIPAAQFARELDRKLRMIEMEE